MIFTVWYSGWAYSIWCVMCSQKLSNVPNSHFSVIDKRCQGLKIALCLSLAPLQSFITVWEYCTHTDNSSLVDSAVSASEPVRAAVILIALLRAVNHGLKRLNCVKIKLYFSLYWFPEYVNLFWFSNNFTLDIKGQTNTIQNLFGSMIFIMKAVHNKKKTLVYSRSWKCPFCIHVSWKCIKFSREFKFNDSKKCHVVSPNKK